MAISVEVPKLGNTVEECIISRWCKRPGELVVAGDVVAEIETDKATFEVTAPSAGTLLERFFEEGGVAPVFARLFVIGEPGETVSAETTPAATPAPLESEAPNTILSAAPAYASPVNGRGHRMSPRARRVASERNLHLEGVQGSGPNGRILERDLVFATPVSALRAPETEPRPALASGTAISSIRDKIARRMRESLATTAQYTLHASAGAAGLLALRSRLPKAINLNHLVALSTVETLLEFPALNAEFRDGRIYTHASVHLGFACDTPRGLLAPVVRNAEELYLDELAARMNEMTAQATGGALTADDLSGATFTISNLGALGIEAFTPLLNPPQVAILGIGSVHLKPVRRNGHVEFVDVIGLSLTCDHQIVDGAPGARFLQALKRNIETVESWCAIP